MSNATLRHATGATGHRWRQTIRDEWKGNTMTDTMTWDLAAAQKPVPDEKGFVELPHLKRHVDLLAELERQQLELGARIEEQKRIIQAGIRDCGATGITINGVRRHTFKKNAPPQWAKFREDYRAIHDAYLVPSQKLDTTSLLRDHPNLVQQYVGYSFHTVTKKGA